MALLNLTDTTTNYTMQALAAPVHPHNLTTYWRWQWRDQLGVVLSAMVAIVTAPGGGGGATLYLPLFTLLLGFQPGEAAALTSFVIFVSAIANTAFALAEPHPTNPCRTRVDWCSVLVMAPPLLLGVSFGVILNSVLPDWVLQAATVIVFAWSLQKVTRSYIRIRNVEKRKAAERQQAKAEADAMFAAEAAAAAAAAAAAEKMAAAAALHSFELQGSITSKTSLRVDASLFADDEAEDAAGAAAGAAATGQEPSGSSRSSPAEDAAMLVLCEARSSSCQSLDSSRASSMSGISSSSSARSSNSRTSLFLADQAAKLNKWWQLQPIVLQLLVLAVLLVHVLFGVMQYTLARACSPLFWELFAAMAVLLALLTGAAVAVVRSYNQCWRDGVQVVVCRSSTRRSAKSSSSSPAAASPEKQATRHNSNTALGRLLAFMGRQPAAAGGQGQGTGLPAAAADLVAAAAVGTGDNKPSATAAAALPSKPDPLADYGPNWEAIQWGGAKLTYMPLVMIVVGATAGCLGLGGGFIVTPMLLSWGLHPLCQATTSRVLLFVSCMEAALLYLIEGRLPVYYGLLHGGISVVLGPLGIWGMERVIAATQRPSLIVLLNMARYGTGICLLLFLGAVPAFVDTARGKLPLGLQLQDFCTADGH